MTREEAIKNREDCLKYLEGIGKKASPGCVEAMRWSVKALKAFRPVSRERVEKFKEYFDDLYGKGLEVYGWHLNGEPKPFDDFYEDACKYAGL